MTCAKGQLVLRLVGGELSSEDAYALRAHVAGCEDCRRAEAELRATWDLLGEWSPTTREAGLLDRVQACAEAAPARRRDTGGMLWLLRRPSLRAAASVVLAAGLGVAAGRLSPRAPRGAEPAAGVELDDVILALGLAELGSPTATGLPDLFSPVAADKGEAP